MKARIIASTLIIGCMVMILASFSNIEKEKYYYGFDERIVLVPKKNTLIVKYSEEYNKEKEEQFIKNSSLNTKIKWRNSKTAEITTTSEELKNNLTAKLKIKKEVYTCQPFYTLENGLDMGVTDAILVNFLPHISEEQQNALHKKYKTTVIKKTKIYQKLLISKGDDALEISIKYYKSGLVKFSTPKFTSKGEYTQFIPNDTYFGNQITCNNTGQIFNDGHSGFSDADIDAPEAWEITTGHSDVVVAILDQGVTPNHPDLPNSRQVRLVGSNFGAGDDDDPSPIGNDNHGNSCAGVIAATMNNNQGIAGIASSCMIMPIRLPEDFDEDLVADAIELAVDNDADIISNSWLYNSDNPNLHPVIITAINYALTNNVIVIFAAGNTADHDDNDNGYIRFPANTNIAGVIIVGASDRYDYQANYSPTNSLIDIVAPSNRALPGQITGETSEMWSIDIPGNTGYNPYPFELGHPPVTGEELPNTGTDSLSYTGRFGGTSHSAPVVAGVAALMLSINPDLNYMDAFDILTNTADKVGGYTYSSGRCDEMGYGRVNAFNAVNEMINRISISGSSGVCYSGSTYTASHAPLGSTISWTTSSNLVVQSGSSSLTVGIRASTTSIYGLGWAQINFTSNGITTAGPIKSIWVGRPGMPITRPSGYPTIQLGVLEYIYISLRSSPGADSNTTDWWVTGNIEISTSSATGCTIEAMDVGIGNFYVTTENGCGTSPTGGGTINVTAGGGGGMMMVFPNPATESFEIQLDESIATSDDKEIESELRIYDQYNSLKEIRKFRGKKHKIFTSRLSKGIYIVEVVNEYGKFTTKVIVNKK